ncbi:RadC family protein [Streptococcus dentasini]
MYTIEIHQDTLRPRERLLAQGAEQLSNQELLAILLRTGTKQQHVLSLANNILEALDNLADFRLLSLEELQAISGIGRVKSIEIKAMLEFAKRVNQAANTSGERIVSSEQLAKKMIADLRDKRQEHLVALYLDTQNRLIKQQTIFIGSVRHSIAEPREILHYACKVMATSLIIAHNHPSGQSNPSQHDITFTKKIKRCCDDLGVELLDHIIVGSGSYYSFREETDLII